MLHERVGLKWIASNQQGWRVTVCLQKMSNIVSNGTSCGRWWAVASAVVKHLLFWRDNWAAWRHQCSQHNLSNLFTLGCFKKQIQPRVRVIGRWFLVLQEALCLLVVLTLAREPCIEINRTNRHIKPFHIFQILSPWGIVQEKIFVSLLPRFVENLNCGQISTKIVWCPTGWRTSFLSVWRHLAPRRHNKFCLVRWVFTKVLHSFLACEDFQLLQWYNDLQRVLRILRPTKKHFGVQHFRLNARKVPSWQRPG